MKVLFVCTGNTCRSPLAEKILQNLRPDLDVRSAGTRALDGDAISENSRQILAQMNLPTTHQAKKLKSRYRLGRPNLRNDSKSSSGTKKPFSKSER